MAKQVLKPVLLGIGFIMGCSRFELATQMSHVALNSNPARYLAAVSASSQVPNIVRNCQLDAIATEPLSSQTKVRYIYCLIHTRLPEQSGLDANSRRLDQGTSVSDILREGFLSAEFSTRFPPSILDNPTFVKFLYHLLLLREADSGGLGTYTTVLNSGTARTDVFMTFISSNEFRARHAVLFKQAQQRNTLNGKFLVGYQGWFSAYKPGDPYADQYTGPQNSWSHWAHWNTGAPNRFNRTVDMWPDLSEFADDEIYPTDLTLSNGKKAGVFSSHHPKTVNRHFRWMKDYGIDGAVLQRFTVVRKFPKEYQGFIDKVAANVRAAAEVNGRTFCILIDMASESDSTAADAVINEWKKVVDLHLTESPNYLFHKGKPVVFIAEFGSIFRGGSPDEALRAIRWIKNAPAPYGATVVGETPAHWRTLDLDAKSDPRWREVYHSYDVINPWTVGIYKDEAGVDNYVNNIMVADIQDATSHGQEYMPVVYPGFSRSNLCGLRQGTASACPSVTFNEVPRNGGLFWWRQMYRFKEKGANMVYGAMFDEVDEGTAIFKIAPTQAQSPVEAPFVSLDIDGYRLPSDWYLQVAREGAKMLRGESPISSAMPLGLPPKVPGALSHQMLYSRGTLRLFSTQSIFNNGFQLTMQADGNLVYYSPSGAGLWSSNTVGRCTQCLAAYQDDGNFVIYNLSNGAAIYSTQTMGSRALLISKAPPYMQFEWSEDTILFDAGSLRLSQNQSVRNRDVQLVMQSDGNLVLYSNAGKALWSVIAYAMGGPYVAKFQSDGNLVISNDLTGRPLNSSRTVGSRQLLLRLASPSASFH